MSNVRAKKSGFVASPVPALANYRGRASIEAWGAVNMSERVVEKIEEFVRQLLPPMGLELVEVQFRREGHGWVLRVFIDCAEGVTVDHCAEVSRELSDFLDVEDLIEHAYHLEISSPGLERPLRSISDFARFTGKKARVKLREEINGQKVFIGNIQNVTEDTVELVGEDGGVVRFSLDQINKARLSV